MSWDGGGGLIWKGIKGRGEKKGQSKRARFRRRKGWMVVFLRKTSMYYMSVNVANV